MPVISPRRIRRLEVAHLPEQGTRDRKLDRDDRLEVLDRHVHDRSPSIYHPIFADRAHSLTIAVASDGRQGPSLTGDLPVSAHRTPGD
jgi:hypothetical protein